MRTYCFRTCISILHSSDNNADNAHVHTVEVAVYLYLKEMLSDIRKFEEIEQMISKYLDKYREKYLNDLEGFEDNADIERLGEVLFYGLVEVLDNDNMSMERLEIGETPLRTYIVTKTM